MWAQETAPTFVLMHGLVSVVLILLLHWVFVTIVAIVYIVYTHIILYINDNTTKLNSSMSTIGTCTP